jgi:3-dehydroquinate synthase
METHRAHLRLDVRLGERSYPIIVGSGVLDETPRHLAALQSSQVAIITHPMLQEQYGDRLRQSIEQGGIPVRQLAVPSGERTKRWEVVLRVLRWLAQHALDRRCVLIALGGGVIGDLVGFAASCYLRGVRYVQIPTTLLAQVDSSVGGKTGVNLPEGKNLVGAFHQPALVMIDIDTLQTLPRRQFRAGLAEVVKYGIIADETLWHLVRQEAQHLRVLHSERLAEIIYRCCALKAAIVSEDETEQGVRAILNFGHTVGHALEAVLGYGSLLHGEAVSIGMVAASLVGEVVGITPAGTAEQVASLLRALRLPVALPTSVELEPLLAAMQRDKKARDGQIRFVLISRIGQALLPMPVDEAKIRCALRLHRERFAEAEQ